MTDPVIVQLPTVEDFERAAAAAGAFYDQLEDLEILLKHIIDPHDESGEWPEGVDIDAGFLGELYTFLGTIDVELSLLRDRQAGLRKQLDRLAAQRSDHVHQQKIGMRS